MKKQMNNAALKVAAKKEVKKVNESARYNLRLANKLAKGNETKGIEGISIQALKEQHKRINEIFGNEGYWWNSVVTDGRGNLVISMRPIKLGETIDETRIIRYRGLSYVIKLGKWTVSNIITSASIRLKQAEEIAKALNAPYEWQTITTTKKTKAKETTMPSKTAKALKDINQRLKAGKLTKAAASAEIEKLLLIAV